MEVTYNNDFIFLILSLILWLYFTSLYFEKRLIILGFAQFLFSMPLIFILLTLVTTYILGLVIVFIIPLLSLWILIDCLLYRNK